MPRKLKPQKIDEYKDPNSGRTIEIMFDRNTHDFFADINGVEVRDETKKHCVKKVRLESERQNKFDWRNIIQVHCNKGSFSMSRGSIQLRYSRHRIAPREDNSWNEHHCYFTYLEAGHKDGIHPTIGRPDFKRYRGATESDSQRGVFVLPYTPHVWEGLKEIERRIVNLRQQLQELLGDPQAVDLLEDLQPIFLLE